MRLLWTIPILVTAVLIQCLWDAHLIVVRPASDSHNISNKHQSQTSAENLMKYGLPSNDDLHFKENYVLSYNKKNKVPNWVLEHLTSGAVERGKEAKSVSRSKCTFHEDKTIDVPFRATLKDYKNSGYDRGHLAAAAHYHQSQRAIDETFALSNVCPQNEYFNQRIWHSLEEHVLELVQKYGSIYVCSGPLYIPRYMDLDDTELKKQQKTRKFRKGECPKNRKYLCHEVIGENEVAVPTHLFKIIVCEGENSTCDMESYIIPNQRVDNRKKFTDFKTSREAIEKAAGYRLFDKLPSREFRYINGEEPKEESMNSRCC